MPFDPEPVDLPELATPQDVADALAQAKTYTDEQVAALAGATPADDEAAETEQNATLADLARRVQILEDEVALPPPATGGAYVGVPYGEVDVRDSTGLGLVRNYTAASPPHHVPMTRPRGIGDLMDLLTIVLLILAALIGFIAGRLSRGRGI